VQGRREVSLVAADRLADGPAAGQEVPHVHLHVRPRFFGDARRPSPAPRRAAPDELAARLRSALDEDPHQPRR